jgi:hypothetical protein
MAESAVMVAVVAASDLSSATMNAAVLLSGPLRQLRHSSLPLHRGGLPHLGASQMSAQLNRCAQRVTLAAVGQPTLPERRLL